MLADKATNPEQYDSPEMNWQILGAEEARQYFRDELDVFVESGLLEGKKVLDIGSGTGQLFNWLKQKGASSVTGIDPATKNIAISTEKYPWATSIVATLSDFAKNSTETFDLAIAILVFEHIQDLNTAFRDVNRLLENKGRFYLFICDKDFSLSNDKELRSARTESAEIVKDLGDGAVEVKTIRDLVDGSQSVMYDIFRPLESVKLAAKTSGFKLLAEKPLMSPTSVPVPMMYVLGFEKAQ